MIEIAGFVNRFLDLEQVFIGIDFVQMVVYIHISWTHKIRFLFSKIPNKFLKFLFIQFLFSYHGSYHSCT